MGTKAGPSSDTRLHMKNSSPKISGSNLLCFLYTKLGQAQLVPVQDTPEKAQ